MQVKLRKIVSGKYDVFGFTVPNNISIFFSGCYFNVNKSGNSIVFTSGTNRFLTDKEVREYQYEDCIVEK